MSLSTQSQSALSPERGGSTAGLSECGDSESLFLSSATQWVLSELGDSARLSELGDSAGLSELSDSAGCSELGYTAGFADLRLVFGARRLRRISAH